MVAPLPSALPVAPVMQLGKRAASAAVSLPQVAEEDEEEQEQQRGLTGQQGGSSGGGGGGASESSSGGGSGPQSPIAPTSVALDNIKAAK